jgi:hypothetical protein
MNRASPHQQQFYSITFFGAASPPRPSPPRRDLIPHMHFFLDFPSNPPYKGDTSALSSEMRESDVKGESFDEERKEESCEEEGCSEEEEVASAARSIRVRPRPRAIGAVSFWATAVKRSAGSEPARRF